MEKLICEICGGETLLKQEDHFRCAKCGVCYSSEQLKQMLACPAAPAELEIAECREESEQTEGAQLDTCSDNVQTQEPKTASPRRTRKIGKILLWVLVSSIPVSIVLFLIWSSMRQSGVIPIKASAKTNAESHLEYRITDGNMTVNNVHFHSVKAQKFKTRDEDSVGYFAYMEKPLKLHNADGTVTEYESHFEHLHARFGETYDPEMDVKWAYTLTGTYDAHHKEHGKIPGEFRIVYVHNTLENCWYIIEEEYGASLDMLRRDVISDLMGYLLATYDIQSNPQIEITSIKKAEDTFTGYTVYGNAVVRDQYGETYSGHFTATYQYTNYDHQFRKLSMQVDDLTRNLWTDILKGK